jgi:hypothetical protein
MELKNKIKIKNCAGMANDDNNRILVAKRKKFIIINIERILYNLWI